MTTLAACPVCTRPYTPAERQCPQCGWELEGAYILGPVTPAVQAAFERDLEAVQKNWQNQRRDLELVCVIDLIGDEATIQWRCTFIAELITEVSQRLHLPDGVAFRVGLLAYGDHNHVQATKHRWHPPPLHRYELGDRLEILAKLNALLPQQGQDFEAAMEDALAALQTLRWSDRSVRFMVTIGHRPPHPHTPAAGWEQIGAPAGHNWQELLKHTQQHLQIYSIAVTCPLWAPEGKRFPRHAMGYADHCWQHIGYTALFRSETVTPAEIAETFMRMYQDTMQSPGKHSEECRG